MNDDIPEALATCASPLCNVRFKPSGMAISPRKYCCDRCRQDVWVLKRAKVILDQVGIITFNALLDQL